MAALLPHERRDLAALEAVVSQGLGGYLAVGEALAEIRARKLWKPHKSFWAYCRTRWPDLSRSRAYQLMFAAEAVGNLSTTVDSRAPPDCEAQVRPLRDLDSPDDRRAVWEQACDEAPGGRPTAARVEELTRKTLAGLSPEAKLDLARREEEQLAGRARAREKADDDGRAAADRDKLLKRIGQARRLARSLGEAEIDALLERALALAIDLARVDAPAGAG